MNATVGLNDLNNRLSVVCQCPERNISRPSFTQEVNRLKEKVRSLEKKVDEIEIQMQTFQQEVAEQESEVQVLKQTIRSWISGFFAALSDVLPNNSTSETEGTRLNP